MAKDRFFSGELSRRELLESFHDVFRQPESASSETGCAACDALPVMALLLAFFRDVAYPRGHVCPPASTGLASGVPIGLGDRSDLK